MIHQDCGPFDSVRIFGIQSTAIYPFFSRSWSKVYFICLVPRRPAERPSPRPPRLTKFPALAERWSWLARLLYESRLHCLRIDATVSYWTLLTTSSFSGEKEEYFFESPVIYVIVEDFYEVSYAWALEILAVTWSDDKGIDPDVGYIDKSLIGAAKMKIRWWSCILELDKSRKSVRNSGKEMVLWCKLNFDTKAANLLS